MSSYHDGRRVEYAVTHHLRDDGYQIIRGSSSKGFADVAALKAGQLLLINVKRTSMPGPAERARLLATAALNPSISVPLVALGPPSKLAYRRLTGPGPTDWEPWTPDEIAQGENK